MLDNLAAQKVAGVEEAIRAVEASSLYLPMYSPDVNPIEQLFAELKALLHKAGARKGGTLDHHRRVYSTLSPPKSAGTAPGTPDVSMSRSNPI